jgi:WD40 repeat protein
MPLDLRNLAVEALLMADARPLATHAHPQSTAAAFSESGRLMVTRSLRAGATRIFTSAIRLLDAASGEVLATCADPRILDAEEGLAVAADGSVAVPGPGELEIDVWDLRAGRVLRSFALPEELVLNERTESQRRLWKLRFSPDGRYLAAACVPHEGFGVTPTKRGWAVWETATGRKLVSVTGGEHLYAWLSFSPDSRELAAPLDVEAIGVAELGDNAHLRWRVDCDQPVRRAALSGGDDPRVFAILGRDDAREDMLVVVRDGGERLHSAGLGCRVAASTEADLAYDPGRELLLFADTDRGLRLVGAGDGLARVTVNVAHEHGIGALTFAGDRILSHGRLGVTRVWEPVADRGLMQAFPMPVRPFGEGERPRARGDYLVLSSDGARAAMIAMHDSASVWGWDVASLDTTWTRLTWPVEDRTVLMIALHATADGAVQVARTCREGVTAWDAAGAGVDVVPSEGGWFDGGAFLDDGTYQCSELGDGGYVRVRLPPGGRAAAMRTALPLPADARFVRLARDDRWAVAAVGEDAEPEQRLFDLAAGTDVPLELGPRPVTSVRADRFVAGDTLVGALVLRDRERLSLCRVPDGSRVCEVPYDAAAGVVAWDVTPDGRTVVVPGADGEVRLHAAADGAELVRWRAAQHPVVFVAALDGGRIATWSGVGSLRVWELERMRSELAARGLAW